MQILLRIANILLLIGNAALILLWRRISLYIDKLLHHLKPGVRWALVPLSAIAMGGPSLHWMTIWERFYITNTGSGLDILLAVYLAVFLPSFLFIATGTAFAPSHKRGTCIGLTVVNFLIASVFAYLSQDPESRFPVICLLAFASLLIGLAVLAITPTEKAG